MTVVPTAEERTVAAPPTGQGPRVPLLRRVLPFAVRPVVIVILAIALYAYISGLTLDSIEARSINYDNIVTDFGQHLRLVAVSTVIVIVIAVPLGVLLTRPALRLATPIVLGLANIGQAIPSVGVIVLLGIVWGIGFKVAVVALVVYAILPVLRNTMVGINQVPRPIIDASKGMGLTKGQILGKVELPLAVPVILAGIRVALILNVGTATLASYTNAGGLGEIIQNGITLARTPVLIAGAGLAGLLALTIDWLAEVVERLLTPRGL